MTDAASRSPAAVADKGRRPLGLLLVAIPVAIVLFIVILPSLGSVIRSFQVETPDGLAWSLGNYVFFFSDGYSLANLWLTVWSTLVVSALVIAVCLPIALYLRFARGILPALVQSLALFPLFVPSIIVAYALIRTLGPNGMADTLLQSVGLPKIKSPYLTPIGPIIGLVWDNLPITLLLLVAGLGNVSKAAIESARDVGAGRLTVFRHIILPQIRNSVIIALAFTVLSVFAAFTLPYLLGPAAPEMMGPFMQRTFGDVQDVGAASTQATVTFLFCALFGLIYVRSIAKGRDARLENRQ